MTCPDAVTIPDWVALLFTLAVLGLGYWIGRRRGRADLHAARASAIEANDSAAASIRESTDRFNDASAKYDQSLVIAQHAKVLVDHDPIPLRRGRVVLANGEPFHVHQLTIHRKVNGDDTLMVSCVDPVGWHDVQLLEELDR